MEISLSRMEEVLNEALGDKLSLILRNETENKMTKLIPLALFTLALTDVLQIGAKKQRRSIETPIGSVHYMEEGEEKADPWIPRRRCLGEIWRKVCSESGTPADPKPTFCAKTRKYDP